MDRWLSRRSPPHPPVITSTRACNLDEQIDDFSAAGIDQQHKFYSDFHNRLAAIQQDSLSAEDRADFEIIDNQVNLSLLELDKIQSYRHNPTVYVELVGNALFNPFVLEYAPLDQRYRADHPAPPKDSGADAAGPGEPYGCAGRSGIAWRAKKTKATWI